MKKLFKTILLLKEMLNESDIPTEKLVRILEKYIATTNEFLKLDVIDKNGVEYLIIKDTIHSIDSFKNILIISIIYAQKKDR